MGKDGGSWVWPADRGYGGSGYYQDGRYVGVTTRFKIFLAVLFVIVFALAYVLFS